MLVEVFFGSNVNIMQLYFDRINVGQSLTKMAVSDIAIAYCIDINAGWDHEINKNANWPVWAITSPDRAIITVGMSEG
jgi:hypothetical protein